MLTVAVEGEANRKIVSALLGKAGVADFEVAVLQGRLGSPNALSHRIEQIFINARFYRCIVVYDQDSGSVADVRQERKYDQEYLENVALCPAIPTVAAWLFADSQAFFEVLGKKAEPFLGRFPLPEQLPYPNFLRSSLLRDDDVIDRLLDKINLLVAGARSPSLKYFIQTARRMSELAPLPFDEASNPAGQISKEILRNLISEVYPSDKPLFRSASGVVITAEQMMQEITNGSDLGREYSSDILRVARDLLSRQAQKSKDGA